MLSLSPAVRIFVHALPTDMRKHFDGLVVNRHPFVRHGRSLRRLFRLPESRENRCKILLWDRDGLVVWAKRLERGCFQIPGGRDAASLAIEVDAVTLAMMIGGVDLDTAKRRKRYQVAAG